MKKTSSWIIAALVPILAVFLPEVAHLPDAIGVGLLTVAGYVGLIAIVTDAVKPFVKKVWKGYSSSGFGGEILSLVVAQLLAFGAYLFEYGIFEYATWYWTMGMAIIAWITAMGWYDKFLKD